MEGIFQEERRKASLFAVQVDRVRDAECPLHQPHTELAGEKPLGRSQGQKGVSWPTVTLTVRAVSVCSSKRGKAAA